VGKPQAIVIAKQKAVILDSGAVIAYLEGEPAAGDVEAIIEEAHDAGVPLLMTVINAGEVWYSVAKAKSVKHADENVFEDLGDLGIILVDVNWNLTRQAAAFKSRGRIAYADCFAAALARQKDAPLVTGDPEFKLLEPEISILWV
jgi:predicted nucleic acid-binding protein